MKKLLVFIIFIQPALSAEIPEMISFHRLGIAIGKTEVTQGEWLAVMGYNPSYFQDCGIDCPVENVYHGEVMQFIEKINRMSGLEFRLPTQEEWNKVCNGSGKLRYCGAGPLDQISWYEGNSEGSTHPVGRKRPNQFGLYDMTGNVWELTASHYEGDSDYTILKGGSWKSSPLYSKASYPYQHASGQGLKSRRYGFRLVRSLMQTDK
jgi:formylglycine-generating enzyme required for sulfatase activity